MSLKHILLGLLREPASGYDLKRQFDGSAAYFWRAELSQIYPTLKGLEDEGLLESEARPSDRGPERRVYRTTAAGRRVLREWLREEPSLGWPRLEYVAQLFFLGELEDPSATRAFVEHLRDGLVSRAISFEQIERRIRSAVGADPEEMGDDDFHPYASVRLARRVAAARLEWCDEILAALARRSARETDREPEHISSEETP